MVREGGKTACLQWTNWHIARGTNMTKSAWRSICYDVDPLLL